MPNYNSTARVPFKHGGSVKKPKVKRIILWKGKAKDWPGAKEAARQTRNRKADGGRIEFKKGGFPIRTSKLKRGADQEFTLQKGVSAAPIKQSKTSTWPPKGMTIKKDSGKVFEGAIKKGLKNPKDYMYMHSKGGKDFFKHIGTRKYVSFKKGGKAKDRHPPKKYTGGSSILDIFKSYGKYKGKPIELKEGGKASDRDYKKELAKWNSPENRKKRQKEYMKKHGERPPRRKRLNPDLTAQKRAVKIKDMYERFGRGEKGKPHSTREGRVATGKRRLDRYRKKAQDVMKPFRAEKAEGGTISLKKGGKADKKWIQKATKGMRKDKPCTGKKFGSATCPPGSKRYNLAQTFKKMARSKHASGGLVRYI